MNDTQPSAPAYEALELDAIVREWNALSLRERFATERARQLCQYFVTHNLKRALLVTREENYAFKKREIWDTDYDGTKYLLETKIYYDKPILSLRKNMLMDALLELPLPKVNELIALCPELVPDTVSLIQDLIFFASCYEAELTYSPPIIKAAFAKLAKAHIPPVIKLENIDWDMKRLVESDASTHIDSAQSWEEICTMYQHYQHSPILNSLRNPQWDNFCTLFNKNTTSLKPAYPHSKREVILALQRKALSLVGQAEHPRERAHEMLNSELFAASHFKRGGSYEIYAALKKASQVGLSLERR